MHYQCIDSPSNIQMNPYHDPYTNYLRMCNHLRKDNGLDQ